VGDGFKRPGWRSVFVQRVTERAEKITVDGFHVRDNVAIFEGFREALTDSGAKFAVITFKAGGHVFDLV
jgi:hypothetical protein